MNIGPIVEVAIGLIFVWIVLSLTTIQLQEWISTRLNKRAQDMEKAIRDMLANPNLKAQFYDHPIIRGIMAEKGKPPSYIPSQQFALSLFDIAMTAGTESSLIQQGLYAVRDELEKVRKKDRDQGAIDALNTLLDLARSAAATEAGTAITNATLEVLKEEAEQFSQQYPQYNLAVEIALNEAKKHKSEINKLLKKKEASNDGDPALVQLRRGITALSVISPELNQTLSALLQNVEDYVTEGETQLGLARKNVEKWFDDSMDRLNGVFKRYSQFMALIIGFIVALLLNVDSINLTIYLWREPSVRQVLVEQASKFELPQQQVEADPEQALQDFRKQFIGLSLPVGWVINESTGSAWFDGQCQLFPGIDQGFGIPVPFTNKCVAPPQTDNTTNILLKLIGIFLSALAARQGAPFWFDFLKRFVNLRGTGANPVEKAGK